MKKGKHELNTRKMKNKKVKNHKFIIFLLIFLLLIFILFLIYYFINYSQITANKNCEHNIVYNNSEIDISRYITGLNSVQILKVDMLSCQKNSTIDLWLKNISNSNTEACNLIFFLLDSNQNNIFGTSISIPSLKANEEKNIKVFCSEDVSTAVDYEIQLDT